MQRFFKSGHFRFLVCVFACGFFQRSADAQPSTLLQKNITFDQIQQKLGLTQASINCLLQDREGYLWIGTWSGLIRFDGYSTTTYYSSSAAGKIKSNKIQTLYEDSKGNLWIGTHMGGLFRYHRNDDTFIHYAHNSSDPESLSSNNISKIQEDKDGNLWVATEYGLNVFDDKQNSFRRFFNENNDASSLSNSYTKNLYLSSDKTLWIATQSGLNRLIASGNSYKFERYRVPNTSPGDLQNYIFDITELQENGKTSIWCSTMKGLLRLSEGKIQTFAVAGKPSPYSFMRCILSVGGDSPFIIAGSELGLHFFDVKAESFKKFFNNEETKGNLSQSTITALYFDRGGVLWVGTKRG